MEKNNLLPYATTCMTLRDIIVVWRSQTQGSTFHMLPFMWSSKRSKINLWERAENSGYSGEDGRIPGRLLEAENVLYLGQEGGCMGVDVGKSSSNCILKMHALGKIKQVIFSGKLFPRLEHYEMSEFRAALCRALATTVMAHLPADCWAGGLLPL